MIERTLLPVANPDADLPQNDMSSEHAPLSVRLVTVIVIVAPLLGLVAAPFFVWGWGFSWVDLGLLLGMYLVTALGITVGFHRLFTHRSFETYVWVKVIFAILGMMAVQGSLLRWVAIHRRHHQHSDTPDDPHSPHHHGSGVFGVLRGFWHAHIGWFFDPDPPELDNYVKDLKKSQSLQITDTLWSVWIALGLIIPAALGGLLKLSWLGVWTGLIWGGLVRILLVHHVTWSVNSACHLWGLRPYETTDQSRDNVVFGILALGEGWHRGHHAYPTSARHGLRWWKIDVSYYVIRLMGLVGLAWKIRLPGEETTSPER
jgi:stearoyl-CoA desaturase (delta-9 desaturase)